jgi:23S rRNA (cytosine1962-C5)-methyltransferase
MLRARLTPAAEAAVRAGSPWVFDSKVRAQNRSGELGELAAIYDRKDNLLALGLWDPLSPLRVRILHRGQPVSLDQRWWRDRLRFPISLRQQWFGLQTNGYRCLNGESDGWPGLVLDRYDKVFVLKLYTAAWLPRLAVLSDLIRHELAPERLVIRLSRNIQRIAHEQFSLEDGQLLLGPPLEQTVLFRENDLVFEADVTRGQKTGFFLDQRENRQQVEKLARACDFLNLFSFSGGFSVYSARGGARSVTDLDLSAHALASGARNFTRNMGHPAIAACTRHAIRADAFEWLRSSTVRRFDVIVLDPPSLAMREKDASRAIGAYEGLVTMAIGRLKPRGVLVAASCSAHVTPAEFFATVRGAATKSKRNTEVFLTTGQPKDHPATFKEAEYLKCIYLRVSP